MPMMGWDGTGWGFGLIFMLLFWVLVVAAIVALVRWIMVMGAGGERSAVGGDRALEILRERYARGEIGKEEFEAKRRDL